MRRPRALALAGAVALLTAGCSTSSDGDGTDGSDGPGGAEQGEVVQVPGVVGGAGSVAFLPGALRVVAPCDGGLCVWSAAGGALVDRLDGGGIVAASGPGIYTDRVQDGTVELVLLDEVTGDEVASVPAYEVADVQDGPSQGLRDVELSPDGRWVAAVGSDGVVRRWTASGLADELTIASEGDAVAVAWSADGSQVAVASSDGPVTIRDASTGEEVGALDAPPQGDVVWSEDGTRIVTASFALDDAAATTVWDAGSLAEVASLPRPGYRLALAGDDAVVLSEKDGLDVLRWDWERDDVRSYSGATDTPRAVLVALGGARTYAVSPRDGVLEWTSPDDAPTVFEKPGE